MYQITNKCSKQPYVKYTKWPQNISNGHKIYQMAIKIYQHLPFQEPPKFTQTGIFGLKKYHLATLVGPETEGD
jgi:hypothetical protein